MLISSMWNFFDFDKDISMKIPFFTFFLAIGFLIAPAAFAQNDTQSDAPNARILAVQESSTIQPDGNVVINRTTLIQNDDNIAIAPLGEQPPVMNNDAVITYDDIIEPLDIENTQMITDQNGTHIIRLDE